jgi:hypothetical protein
MRQVIGRELASFLAAMRRVAILHSSILNYTCATGHLGVGLVGGQSVTVNAVTPDHSEAQAPQYHILPKDDAVAVVDIMRAAAGLPPPYDEHDDGRSRARGTMPASPCPVGRTRASLTPTSWQCAQHRVSERTARDQCGPGLHVRAGITSYPRRHLRLRSGHRPGHHAAPSSHCRRPS